MKPGMRSLNCYGVNRTSRAAMRKSTCSISRAGCSSSITSRGFEEPECLRRRRGDLVGSKAATNVGAQALHLWLAHCRHRGRGLL